jgi:hypothetical protein
MTDSDTRAAVIADLIARLRPVCEQWPDDLFDAMVDRLADITVKYDRLASGGSFDRRSTERLVSELKDALERNQAARGEDPEIRRSP